MTVDDFLRSVIVALEDQAEKQAKRTDETHKKEEQTEETPKKEETSERFLQPHCVSELVKMMQNF